MTLVTQTDFRLEQPVRRWGCNLRSIQGGIERFVEKPLTVDQIMKMYNKLLNKEVRIGGKYRKVLTNDCIVGLPREIIKESLKLLGYRKWYGYQVGRMDPEGKEKSFWDWVTDEEVTFSTLRWESYDGEHFTLGDEGGEEMWDPWPGSGKVELKEVLLYQVKRG